MTTNVSSDEWSNKLPTEVMNQRAVWADMKEEYPIKTGWYLVRYIGETEFAMFFEAEKSTYSDSQWFVNSGSSWSWKGQLPDQWLELTRDM